MLHNGRSRIATRQMLAGLAAQSRPVLPQSCPAGGPQSRRRHRAAHLDLLVHLHQARLHDQDS